MQSCSGNRTGSTVLDTFVHASSMDEALDTSVRWTNHAKARTICFCNVHALVTASVHPQLSQSYANADLVLPDGAPVAWMLRLLGHRTQKRVSGPDFMWRLCGLAEQTGAPIYLYGNRTETLEKLSSRLMTAFPRLKIAGTMSPPFRPLTRDELDDVIDTINHSGARICFVSLGCPKQEIWMLAQKHRLHSVLLGVGAAFDYHAGTVQRPPVWARNNGLEWLGRLTQDPKRLWKRYLLANSIFMWRALGQLLDHALNGANGPHESHDFVSADVGEAESSQPGEQPQPASRMP